MAAAEQSWLDEQLKNVVLNFEQADRDKNGSLSLQEVFMVLKQQGYKGDINDVLRVFNIMDADGDKRVSKDEFAKAFSNLPVVSRREIALFKAFQMADKDGSGALSLDEIRSAASEGNLLLSFEQIKSVWRSCHNDEDRKVQYDEFIRALNFSESESMVKKIFDQLDKDNSGSLSLNELKEALQQEGELARMRINLEQCFQEIATDPAAKDITFNKFSEAWFKKRDFIMKNRTDNPYL